MPSFTTGAWRRTCMATLALGLGLALSGCGGDDLPPATPDTAAAPPADPTIVKTTEGPVSGSATTGYTVYKGIPYAAPPVGPLRWAATAPPAAHSATLQATTFGAACAQTGTGAEPQSSEDCLYLNVWKPAGAKQGSKLPVMVYMHGGAFTIGSGAMTDVSKVVAQQVVTVAFNYRLGALGNLANSTLRTANGSLGNFALMDALAALKWVQKNVDAFGGDPGNVTMWGLSAGATQTFSLVQSPMAKGLFQKAILQSGGSGEYSNLTPATALGVGDPFVAKVGCGSAADQIACLRALPVATILSAQTTGKWRPVVDGTVLTEVPSHAFQSGNFNRIPVMIGGVFDEGTLFADQTESAASYLPYLHSLVPAGFDTTKLDAAYPAANFAVPAQGYARALGDSLYACANSSRRDALSAYVPVYGWEFTDPVMSFPAPQPTGFYYGSSHGMDSMYFFGMVDGLKSYPYMDAAAAPTVTSADGFAQRSALSAQMLAYVTNFIRAGDPNGQGKSMPVNWPLYGSAADRKIIALTLPSIKVTSNEFETAHNCSTVWQGVPNTY